MLLVLQPHVRFPADWNNPEQETQRRVIIFIGARLAKRRAWFFSSISLSTEGGSCLILGLGLDLGLALPADDSTLLGKDGLSGDELLTWASIDSQQVVGKKQLGSIHNKHLICQGNNQGGCLVLLSHS